MKTPSSKVLPKYLMNYTRHIWFIETDKLLVKIHIWFHLITDINDYDISTDLDIVSAAKP